MDHHRFLAHAIQIAQANLPYCDGDKSRAARTALQEAHVNLPQEVFFTALDALGGHRTVVHTIMEALQEEAR
jgi:hypothetical protein